MSRKIKLTAFSGARFLAAIIVFATARLMIPSKPALTISSVWSDLTNGAAILQFENHGKSEVRCYLIDRLYGLRDVNISSIPAQCRLKAFVKFKDTTGSLDRTLEFSCSSEPRKGFVSVEQALRRFSSRDWSLCKSGSFLLSLTLPEKLTWTNDLADLKIGIIERLQEAKSMGR